MQLSSSLDQVILVDDQDNQIGVMDKIEAHRGEAKLHRAISVYLFNDQGELLLQQRSPQKIVGANQWANTCCGNLWPGESYEECAQRRLKAELGIEGVELTPVHKFKYAVRCNDEFGEHEMDQVFVGKFNGQVKGEPDEISDWRWANFDQLQVVTDSSYAPWFRLMMQDKHLLQKLKGEVWVN